MNSHDILEDLNDIEDSKSPTALPQIAKQSKSGSKKFSSWNTGGGEVEDNDKGSSFMDEVDELLLEQELLSPSSKVQVLNKKQSQGSMSPVFAVIGVPNKQPVQESLRDSAIEKLMNGGAIEDLYSPVKQYKTQDEKKLQIKKIISDELKAKAADFPDDDFDLEKPEDLNRFINKYETSISSKKQEQENSQLWKDGDQGAYTIITGKRKGRNSDMNDIDSLVEEELSRNSNDIKEEFDNPFLPSAPSLGIEEQIVPQGGKSGSQLSGKEDLVDASSSPANPAKKMKGSDDGAIFDEDLDLSGSGNNESQMFKELFATTNTQKQHGITGISAVSVSVSHRDSKQLNKNRSKKELKNKFQSSSAPYEGNDDADQEQEIAMHIKQPSQDQEDKENKAKESKVQKANKTESKHSKKKSTQKNDDNVSDDEDVDEIIKQHLMEEQEKKIVTKSNKGKSKKSNKNEKKVKNGAKEAEEDLFKFSKRNQKGEKIDINKDLVVAGKDSEEIESDEEGTDEDEIYGGDNDDFEDPDDAAKKLSDEDDGYDSDSLDLREKSPKTTLIEHLKLMSDIFNSSVDGASDYYDQLFDERAQFMLDFENILKIMTFDETVEYVLPCMQIYSSEQDYLKLKLFQNLDKLFKKLFKASIFIPKEEIIDIITINIFPLASRMLMLSDELVQIEGVSALLNLCQQYIPKEQASMLMIKVIQVIMDRISPNNEYKETEEVKERAKIAVLIIVTKFAEGDVFEKDQCNLFLEKHLAEIQDGMLFKLKKFLLPALISISKHLDYDVFIDKVYATFTAFREDEIHGVRKVCIENMSNLIKHLQDDADQKLDECFEFFKKCLYDSNRQVKNAALEQFGPIVHQIYLKQDEQARMQSNPHTNSQFNQIDISQSSEVYNLSQMTENEKNKNLKALVHKMCITFYDQQLLYNNGDEKDLEDSLMKKLDEYSFMQNQNDDVDNECVRYQWAYNLPCALMVNGRQQFWLSHLKVFYDQLYRGILINLRTTMASGFLEVINHLDIETMEKLAEQEYLITILNHFLKDSDEKISQKVLPTICTLVSKFPEAKKTELLGTLIKTKIEDIKQMKNVRDGLITMLEQLFEMFGPHQLLEADFHEYLFDIIKNERAINYKVRAAKVIGAKIVAPLIKGKKYRALLTTFTDELRVSKNFRDRQLYINIAASAYQADNEIFKKHFAKNVAADLENEPCKCVKIVLAKLCNEVPDGYSKSLDKVRVKLLTENDPHVIQHMPSSAQGKQQEDQRRLLKLNYGEEEGKQSEGAKDMTEQEWLDKEQKEIEEVEKTVTIRFANYSTLMRTQTLTQGLSSQLAMLYLSGGASRPPVEAAKAPTAKDTALTKMLLAGAGILQDGAPKDSTAEAKGDAKPQELHPRSLSPLLETPPDRLPGQPTKAQPPAKKEWGA